MRDIVQEAMSAVYHSIMEKVNSSWSWGYDLIQNLINRINWLLNDLVNTVANVANCIWEYLHFSVPDKGLLTDFESWVPDFMQGLAKGIQKNQKFLENAVNDVAEAMQLTPGL